MASSGTARLTGACRASLVPSPLNAAVSKPLRRAIQFADYGFVNFDNLASPSHPLDAYHAHRSPQTFPGSVPRSKRRRSQTPQRRTIGLTSHRGEPKTSGADRRLTWWLGVDFPDRTLPNE